MEEGYIEYNKIYARVNANGIVVDIFSEAFKTPTENDVCINATNTDRHGAQRYQVYDEHGIANYAIINDVLVVRDKSAELARIKMMIDYPQLVENKIRTKYSDSATASPKNLPNIMRFANCAKPKQKMN